MDISDIRDFVELVRVSGFVYASKLFFPIVVLLHKLAPWFHATACSYPLYPYA